MTPEQLKARAVLIYGAEWQSALARRVAVDARTVRRWKAGDRDIPGWLEWALGVLERHADER